jgi:hypothetical protein
MLRTQTIAVQLHGRVLTKARQTASRSVTHLRVLALVKAGPGWVRLGSGTTTRDGRFRIEIQLPKSSSAMVVRVVVDSMADGPFRALRVTPRA